MIWWQSFPDSHETGEKGNRHTHISVALELLRLCRSQAVGRVLGRIDGDVIQPDVVVHLLRLLRKLGLGRRRGRGRRLRE